MVFLEHVALLVAGLSGFALWPNVRRRAVTETSGAVHGIPCNFTQRAVSRSNQATITIAIPCDERFEFTLRRENVTDRVAKALRLVREFQTQDQRFDEAVYIGADESGFDEWLAEDAEARKEFLDLLALQPQEYTRVTRINASLGTLTLSALAKPPMFERAPPGLALVVAEASVPQLQACAERLRTFASSQADPAAFRDPYAGRIRTLTSLTLGLFVVPMVLFILLQGQKGRIEFAANPFADTQVWTAVALVLCALIVLTFALLRKSARLHMVLLPLLFAGATGAAFAAPAFLREVNEEWDQSVPQRYAAQVLDRYVTHGKNSTTYHVWLSDWHSQADHRELRVDAATYNDLQVGDTVGVTEREGYLGRAWISDFGRDVPIPSSSP